MKIIVATHNEGKLAEIRRILEERLGADAADIELVSAGSLGLPDPVEDGVTFQENALIKARDVAERTGCPAVADDSGLIVDVMGNAPGICPHAGPASTATTRPTTRCCSSSWPTSPTASAPHGSAAPPRWSCQESARRTVRMMISRTRSPAKPSKSAKCRACCCVPAGPNGFGYDPLFVPNDQPQRAVDAGEKLTSAEMEPAEKNAVSHRGKALRSLVASIEALVK